MKAKDIVFPWVACVRKSEENDKLELKLAAARERITRLNEQTAKLKLKLAAAREQITRLREQITRLREQITKLKLQIATRQVDAKRIRKGPDGEKDSAWYDTVYSESIKYSQHYALSPYYFLWSVIIDRLSASATAPCILDLGCGPGQFAEYLEDKGFPNYLGVDFSNTCIEMAKKRCPKLSFLVADARSSSILEERYYNYFISLEFFEHVEFDQEIMCKIRPHSHCIISVPNFPSESHVRHFASVSEVMERYGSFFRDLTITTWALGNAGGLFFLLDGFKK